MICEYCTNEKDIDYKDENDTKMWLFINGNNLCAEVDTYGFSASIFAKINYCPICGKALKEENN